MQQDVQQERRCKRENMEKGDAGDGKVKWDDRN